MIEKNIFQSWYTRDLHPLVKQKVDKFRALNPDYNYHLFTDDDMDNFVNEHFKGEIADCFNKINIIVAKVDFWRYLVLYKYGGVYLDMDSSIEINLNKLIREDDDAIISVEGNPGAYLQWGLIYKKEHPILKKTIEFVVDNIKNNRFPNSVLRMTGPTVYSRAINVFHYETFNRILIHKNINRNTDITFKTKDVSYRIFGVDYNGYFTFKHDAIAYLYNGRKQWLQEEKEKPVLK